MKNHPFMLAALVTAFFAVTFSPLAHADLSGAKQDIKRDAKAAAHKTGAAARSFGHATAHAAKAVGHGIAHVSREGYDATRRTTKRVFHRQT